MPRRLVAALANRLLGLTEVSFVDQVFEGIISDDHAFFSHVRALAATLQGKTSGERELPPRAAGLLADLPRLALAVDHATGVAEDADMMGTASPFQSTLRMRSSATYHQDGPPPEVMDLIAAYQKVPLALLLLVYIQDHHPEAPEALLVELARIVREGHLARLTHLAALGYEVPEELVAVDTKPDMEAIYAEHNAWKDGLRQEAETFAARRASGAVQ